MAANTKPLAMVTGASSGIGYELAKLCAQNGFNLVIAADEPTIDTAAQDFRNLGAEVQAVQADLATTEGIDKLLAATQGRRVDALLANAGHGISHAFLDENFGDIKHVIDTNIMGTVHLIHTIGRDMRARGEGRILITGSIAGLVPGPYNAVYNASKAFIDSFAPALRAELKDAGITVTCLLPGATDTNFFARADMLDTAAGQAKKDDPAFVAKVGFEAMMKGEGDVVSGLLNKVAAIAGNLAPADLSAKLYGAAAAPGSAPDTDGKKN